MRRHVILALIISGIGVLGLVAVIAGNESVRSHIKKHYTFVRKERASGNDDDTLVYASRKPVTKVAKDIADAVKPADRRVTESGVFLRYSNDVVAIQPDGRGGSQIFLDDQYDGYRRNYFYVGGFWGTYSGPAESFRGGGPGGIK